MKSTSKLNHFVIFGLVIFFYVWVSFPFFCYFFGKKIAQPVTFPCGLAFAGRLRSAPGTYHVSFFFF